MTVWNQVMVDVESMGTKSHSALVSIGAVMFNLQDYAIGPQFHIAVHLASSVGFGMTMDPSTVMWWLRQGQAARDAILTNLYSLDDALRQFDDWYRGNCEPKDTRTWGNSSRFDLGILETAHELTGIEVPWRWNLETCFRTVRSMNDHIVKYDVSEKVGTAHHAVDDAIFQVNHLFKVRRANLERRAIQS